MVDVAYVVDVIYVVYVVDVMYVCLPDTGWLSQSRSDCTAYQSRTARATARVVRVGRTR